MIRKDDRFVNVSDPAILNRLSRSEDIKVINRFEHFEAKNTRNRHVYQVKIAEDVIACRCHDTKMNEARNFWTWGNT